MTFPAAQPSEDWLDADSPQQYRTWLLYRLLIAALVVLAAAVIGSLVLWDRIERAERDDDLAFTASLALASPEHAVQLALASGREALIWRPGEQPDVFAATAPVNPRFDRWRVSIRDEALSSAEGRFLRFSDSGGAESSTNAGPADSRWRIEVVDGVDAFGSIGQLDGATVLFANAKTGRYLSADPDGRAGQSPSAADGDRWVLDRIRSDVFAIEHADSGLVLHASGADSRYRVDLSDGSGRDTEWELVPRNDATFQLLNESRSSIEDRQFNNTDPAGDAWWHTTMDTIDGATLVTSRRATDAMALARVVVGAIGAAALVSLLALVWLWRSLGRRVGQPLQRLVTAGEDLRVRGELRPPVRAALSGLQDRPSEFRELARILEGIEAETIRGRFEAESLLAAASALGASLESATVLARTLEQLELLLKVNQSAILSYDSRIERVEVIASRGHSTEYLDELVAGFTDPTIPSRRAARDRAPVQVSNTESELVSPEMRDRSRRHGYRSVLAVPLTADLEHPTVLTLHTLEPHTFSFDEIELSKSFASIAGAAIRNAELFARTDEDLRTQSSQLDAIVESVDQAILVEAADGEIVYANSRMLSLAGGVEQAAAQRSETIIDAIADRTPDPSKTREQLSALGSRPEDWLDVEITSGPDHRRSGAEFYRVRAFEVVDSRRQRVGRGQVWANVTGDRELDRMKQGLLATVSHEFRTPLALIKGYATTLLAEDVEWDPQEQNEFLTMVSVEADRLSSLVQRLLDMRRIDAGMVTLQKIPTELGVIIASTLDGMPHHRSRVIVGELPEVSVSIDAARVITALRNLIENACTYSPGGSVVEVAVTLDARTAIRADTREGARNNVIFTVRDYGSGVEAHLRDRIFDTFVRGDSALNAEFGGIGLGLAIARGFVEAHGGRIWVADPETGPGSVFAFSIPYDRSLDPVGQRS